MEWLKSLRLGGSRRTNRSGKGGRSRRYRRAGGPEPDEPIGMTTPSTNPVPQPRPQYDPYLAAATAVAFPVTTALSLSAQAKRKGGRSRRSRQYRRAGGLEPDEEPSGSSVSNSPIPIRPILPPAPRPRMTPEEIAVAASLAQAAEEANIAPYRK